MIVVDSNVLAARNLTGTATCLSRAVEIQDPVWIAPPLWRYEFQNILAKAIWARQITAEQGLQAWRATFLQMAGNEHDSAPDRVLDLSSHYRITAYDANFIALAMEMNVICVTEDGELQRKFPAIAVSMKDFTRTDWTGGMVRETPVRYRTRKRT